MTETRRFSWLAMIGGLALTLAAGCVLTLFAVGFGAAIRPVALRIAAGALPGVLFLLLAYAMRKNARSFAIGMVIGACMVGLLGGMCGSLDFS